LEKRCTTIEKQAQQQTKHERHKEKELESICVSYAFVI